MTSVSTKTNIKDTHKFADFSAGAGAGDIIELYGVFASYQQLLAAATDTDDGSAVVIALDAHNSLTLEGVSKADLHEDDFRFLFRVALD